MWCTILYNIVYYRRYEAMKPLKSKISITLDSDMIAILKQLAEEDDRSLSQCINLILKNHLRNLNHQKNTTRDL